VTARPGIAQLGAVKRGQVHGLSHQLLNSPIDILAVEALAKWIHPDLFAALDPARTMAELNAKFLAVPLEGTLWIDLR
jgi:iron complex transport system substrate-binding protein